MFKQSNVTRFIMTAVILSVCHPNQVKATESNVVEGGKAQVRHEAKKNHAADPRMGYAGNLIYRSTAAQQIKNSQNKQAHKLYQDAQSLYQKISTKGSPEQNKQLLDKALAKMFSAVQLAEPEKVRAEKLRHDFSRKKESIHALLDAHDRVAKEKHKTTQGKLMQKQVSQLLTQADALYQQEDYAQGKGILDGALNLLKNSIEQMRGGDTLVKGLKFESKQEEYAYELDRNDTHMMLIKVLLDKKRKKSASLDRNVRAALELSSQYRNKAEKMAMNNEYQAAVEWLEKATLELVKVIRRGGIYIPSA